MSNRPPYLMTVERERDESKIAEYLPSILAHTVTTRAAHLQPVKRPDGELPPTKRAAPEDVGPFSERGKLEHLAFWPTGKDNISRMLLESVQDVTDWTP
ncbi:hypothetical protein LTR85_008119 [Meristemomyces frigidus]|nr:hypothetical protein LTR85_008119 [Meristemomyces frigidus]